MSDDALVCESCQKSFSLSPATRKRYPGWRPKQCMACREPSATRSTPAKASSRRPAPPAGPATGPADGVFTDGSCQGNPGPGGWGAVVVRDDAIVAERNGFDPLTTNNRMELTAIIEGLRLIDPSVKVTLYSDSNLAVQTLTKWAADWEKRGWKRREGEVKNLDLVQEAWRLVQERPLVTIAWIPAHSGYRWNEHADALSTAHVRAGS